MVGKPLRARKVYGVVLYAQRLSAVGICSVYRMQAAVRGLRRREGRGKATTTISKVERKMEGIGGKCPPWIDCDAVEERSGGGEAWKAAQSR